MAKIPQGDSDGKQQPAGGCQIYPFAWVTSVISIDNIKFLFLSLAGQIALYMEQEWCSVSQSCSVNSCKRVCLEGMNQYPPQCAESQEGINLSTSLYMGSLRYRKSRLLSRIR